MSSVQIEQKSYEMPPREGISIAPIPKYGEIRCYIRDLDGYIIEVGQSTTVTYG